jgi:hypothetical protein
LRSTRTTLTVAIAVASGLIAAGCGAEDPERRALLTRRHQVRVQDAGDHDGPARAQEVPVAADEEIGASTRLEQQAAGLDAGRHRAAELALG